MASSGQIGLNLLPRALRERFGDTPSYSKLYLRVLDGRVPAKHENGRWIVELTDLDEIGAILGLRQEVVSE